MGSLHTCIGRSDPIISEVFCVRAGVPGGGGGGGIAIARPLPVQDTEEYGHDDQSISVIREKEFRLMVILLHVTVFELL